MMINLQIKYIQYRYKSDLIRGKKGNNIGRMRPLCTIHSPPLYTRYIHTNIRKYERIKKSTTQQYIQTYGTYASEIQTYSIRSLIHQSAIHVRTWNRIHIIYALLHQTSYWIRYIFYILIRNVDTFMHVYVIYIYLWFRLSAYMYIHKWQTAVFFVAFTFIAL